MQADNTNPTPKVQFVDISAEYAGQRIDNYLICRLKGVPKGKIYSILRKGEVRVNKGRIKPEYRLKEGDSVRIPPIRISQEKPAEKPGDRVLQLIEQRILYEDKRIIVVNKPSGIAVHGGSGISYGIIEAVRAIRPDCPHIELAHRLDRDTSGCLILAKKRSVLRHLHEQLRSGKMDKRYFALVKGKWQSGSRWIDAPLLKNTVRSGERIVQVDKTGKPARSEFIPYSVTDKASLMTVKLDTGRTHQIRVHAQHSGHPLAGDEKYGEPVFNRQLRNEGLKRLFLHAYSLKFSLSDDEPPLYIEAPLDKELVSLLKKLKIEL